MRLNLFKKIHQNFFVTQNKKVINQYHFHFLFHFFLQIFVMRLKTRPNSFILLLINMLCFLPRICKKLSNCQKNVDLKYELKQILVKLSQLY